MKKVLLGLLALSAVTMATPSTGVTGGAGENQIDITTKAFIINSGLIITESADGTAAIKSVELDHGTIMLGRNTDSTVNRNVFIRKTNGSNFPEGTVLGVSLDGGSKNQLKNGDNVMKHTLTAKVDVASATGEIEGNTLTVEDTTTSAEDQFTVAKDKGAVGVNLMSTINQSQYASGTGLVEGAYENISTLSVKLSKVPQTPGEAVSTPEVE